jgi:hypothetical protein
VHDMKVRAELPRFRAATVRECCMGLWPT